VPAFERRPESKNPAQGRVFARKKTYERLPGGMWDFRSTRARGHAGSHAGAGHDTGIVERKIHPVC